MCEYCQHKEAIDPHIDGMWLKPVGVVVSEVKQPSWGASPEDMNPETRNERHRANIEKSKQERKLVSELVIDSDLVDGGILDGIEDFSHLLVLYWPHLVEPEGRTLMQGHPLGREDFPLVGIFATRSPMRPNPVLLTTVKLVERHGNVLRVTGLDAVDGSPIIDIKPYTPGYHEVHDVRLPEWMELIQKEFSNGECD
jgi:tRNA-Thr(GGU) m(6)t(6)A37 methyltransferase TsaA